MKLPSGRSVGRAPVVAAWSFVTCAAIACGQVTVAGNSSASADRVAPDPFTAGSGIGVSIPLGRLTRTA